MKYIKVNWGKLKMVVKKNAVEQLEVMNETLEYILSVIDVGFGYTKIFSNIKPGSAVIPSAVSTTPMVSPGNMKATADLDSEELVVEIDGEMSYVGARALIDMTPTKKRTRNSDRANDPISKVLFRTAVALSLPDIDGEFDNVHVVTGLPNRDYGTQIHKDLEAFLLEPFTIKFHINKTTCIEKRINVSKVTIYHQPLGSYTYDQYRYGDIAQGESVVTFKENAVENIGIIEIGQQTTDFAIIVRGEITERGRTIGSVPGVNEVYSELEPLIEKKVLATKKNGFVTVKEVDLDKAILTKVFKESKHDHDVEEEVKFAVQEVATPMISYIFDKWGGQLERLDQVLISGGGAELFEEALTNEFQMRTDQTFSVVEDSQYANILGYYMRAVLDLSLEVGDEKAHELLVEGVFK